ncbi:MAG: enoyl-CoA hydratase/isomerase family protein [Actinomycetota bacterium]
MPPVEVNREESVAWITLNRPEVRNALSGEMCEDLVVALHGVEREPDVRAVVFRGAGPVFCAGADIAGLSGPAAADFLQSFEQMLEAVARSRLPTIAAINGAALGGGFQLATVCDFRVAGRTAKLGVPAAKLGILVNFENVQRLVLLAGIGHAKEMLLAGSTYTGEEALPAGLVNAVAEDDRVDSAARHLGVRIAGLAPLSVQGAKRAIQAVIDHLASARATQDVAVAEIDRLVLEAYASQDLAEGIAALGDKRPPNFTGR